MVHRTLEGAGGRARQELTDDGCHMTEAYITSLIRHFEDLRDGTHGGSASRKDKEAHFKKAVQLLAPVARRVLTEVNTSLLLDTGHLAETGLRRTAAGGLNASGALTWPEP